MNFTSIMLSVRTETKMCTFYDSTGMVYCERKKL